MDPKELRETLAVIVEELLDEAIRRDNYIEGLINAMKGAAGEYFKARYAEVNMFKRRHGTLGTQQGWDKEATNRIHFNFQQAAMRTMKGGSKRKCFDEAVAEIRIMIPKLLEWAKMTVADDFGLDKSDMIDTRDSTTDELLTLFENAFDEATANARHVP